MTTERSHDPILWSTIAITLLLAMTAVAGLFWPATYAREASRDGGVASDIVDLFLVLPVLLISGIRGYRGSVPARLVWLGALGYLLYNFVFYTLGVHFNALFLVYCATMSLCFYAAIFCVPSVPVEQIAQAYGPRAPLRANICETVLVLLINEQGEKEKGRDEREFSWCCSFPGAFGWRGTERRRAWRAAA